MPKRVLIIGLLFCLGGVVAIWDVLQGLFASRISLNFAVLLLPVGIGLLRGKPSSRWWAKFWIVLGYILCAVLLVIAVLSPDSAYATWFERELRGREAVPFVIGISILFLLLLVALQRLLDSEKALSYFKHKKQRDGAVDGGLAEPLGHLSDSKRERSAYDRYSVMKNRASWGLHVSAIVLVAFGVVWFSWGSFRPNWRFWQYESRGQVPIEWAAATSWQSPRDDRDAVSDSENYLLHVVASKQSETLAELRLRIQFAVQGEGYPVSIAVSDETVQRDRPYSMSSISEWDEASSSFQIGVVSIPEKSRHYVTWPRVNPKRSSSSIGGPGIGSCPMVMFSLTNIFVDKDHSQLARTAFLDVRHVQALMVAKKYTPRGMFPGGEQPVSWTIELIPEDANLPVQKFVIPEGETEP